MAYNNILEKIENIPFDPGCYIYKDKSGKVIYVGKAINLRKRVRQYFDRDNFEDPKIEVLRSNIDDVEWITVKTETEAYILESNLIKKYRPKFNKLQKDDKSYVWIKITNEVYPRILRVREKKRDKAKYYGPYPNGNAARKTINFLRKVYPYRVCNKKMYDKFVSSSKNKVKNNADKMYKNENDTFRHTKESRLCLDYHLGLCSGVCDNLISSLEYSKSINKIFDFLEGKQVDLLKQLSQQMKAYAINLDYENAAIIRDRINELAYITQKINVKSGQDEEIIRNKNEKAMEKVAKKLFDKLGISNVSDEYRIECYDVSNIQGTNPIVSMVVFEKGTKSASNYRFFRINLKQTPDDVHMMEEGLCRRLKYLANKTLEKEESFSIKPDLIIVDGGKGQLSMALKVIEKYNLKIPVVGIAKSEETILKKNNGKYKEYRLRKDSPTLHLVQRIRDEAHRFAITKHRNLRGKKVLTSVLMEIPGVGKKTFEKLIKEFENVDSIRKASFEDLTKTVNSKAKAAQITKFFHE